MEQSVSSWEQAKPVLDRLLDLRPYELDAETTAQLHRYLSHISNCCRYHQAIPLPVLVEAGVFLTNVERRVGKTTRTSSLAAIVNKPPERFTFLLACVARPGRADEVLGDAEEEFRKMIAQFGVVQARWLYRVYVLRVVIGMLPGVLTGAWVLHKLWTSICGR
jgi:hypothetical protein